MWTFKWILVMMYKNDGEVTFSQQFMSRILSSAKPFSSRSQDYGNSTAIDAICLENTFNASPLFGLMENRLIT